MTTLEMVVAIAAALYAAYLLGRHPIDEDALETHLSEFVDVDVSWVGEALAEEVEVWLTQA